MHWRDIVGLAIIGSLAAVVWYRVATEPPRANVIQTELSSIHTQLVGMREDISSLYTLQAKTAVDLSSNLKAQQVSSKSTANALAKLQREQKKTQYTLVEPRGTLLTRTKYAEIER